MQIKIFLQTMFLCTLFIQFKAQAQSAYSIYGRVNDNSGVGLDGVTVTIISANNRHKETITAQDGSYSFKQLSAGKYRVKLKAVGYKEQLHEVNITTDKNNIELIVQLEVNEHNLKEVKVTGKAVTQELKESGFAVNAIETKRFANTTTNINQLLDQTSGIRVRQSGGLGSTVNFSINGLSGSAVKYFIDGVPIESMGGVMSLNNIPVNLVKSVEVYKGVVPVEFGADAMGGVVNLVTNENQRSFIDASFSTGSFATQQASVSSQYSSSKTGFIVRANGFFNYSKNNYIMRDVEVYDSSQKKFTLQDHRRFHDKYLSALGMVEAGFANKKWADIFLIGASYSIQNNDIQNGTTQNILYGKAGREEEAFNASVKYKKKNLFTKGLSTDIFASISKNDFSIIDTAYRLYTWDGKDTVTNRAEISHGARSIRKYNRPTITSRINLSYKLSDQHAFSLNYQLNHLSNSVHDELNVTEPSKDQITKHIIGLAYQQSLLNNRLSNTFFVKYYGIKLKIGINNPDSYYNSYFAGDADSASGYKSNWGYGLASRYKITENIGIKASYEYTYRLQEPEEILGNGYSAMPNFDLKPESSRNYNLGFYLGNNSQKHHIFFEGSGFIRSAQDYIQGIFREALGMTQYQNTSTVRIKGVEGEVKYTYKQLLNFNLNVSYQNAVNKTVLNGSPEITYGYKLPNRPWLFGNAAVYIGKNDVLGKNTRIQFGWSSQYIHWFYLTWANFGNPKNKSAIPSQFIHNILLSYSLKDSKYNISFECKNLMNNLSYDNYKLQKPGRAYYVKLRVFLRK